MPPLPAGRKACFELPPSLRRECDAAILERWRASVAMTESVSKIARAAA